MGMSGGGGGGLQSEINVTPMVDIMLVLLIIFMVVTPMLQSGVTVILPRGKNPDEDGGITKDSAVVVSVPSNGVYYLGRDPIRKDSIVEKITNRFNTMKPSDEKIVYIKGSNNVQYGDIVDLINMIRESGFEKIGLVSDKKKPNE